MTAKIQMLDCTLRDGAYIVDSKFGAPAIKGIIKKLQDANIDIIECGWLKDKPYKPGTTFYHVPGDLEQYLIRKDGHATYVAMIDWDRYNLDNLPPYDGKSIDAIRVVFPREKFREGIALGEKIRNKGYQVYFQAANTLGYTDDELIALADEINKAKPVCLSVVDTFGAMYSDDLARIIGILDKHINRGIKLGFHSHNNQQLSFSLSIQFVETLSSSDREIIVDGSLCGMGRGAGNTTTELMVNYLNRKFNKNYDVNVIMDAIDMYMGYFIENYQWGYSIPYLISGFYCAHVNNIAYLINDHRTNSIGIKNIIESLSPDDRKKYDYDLLEQKYVDYQSKVVEDEAVLSELKDAFMDRKILLILPGKTIDDEKDKIDRYIERNHPVVIGVNSVAEGYDCDYLFFSNTLRYEYAKEIFHDIFSAKKRIVTSNIKTATDTDEMIVNFNLLVKRGWEHFDNAGVMCLRLLNKVHASDIALAGFDGFEDEYDKSYYDTSLPRINPGKKWDELNAEIKDMLEDYKKTTSGVIRLEFVTTSKFA